MPASQRGHKGKMRKETSKVQLRAGMEGLTLGNSPIRPGGTRVRTMQKHVRMGQIKGVCSASGPPHRSGVVAHYVSVRRLSIGSLTKVAAV